MLPSISQTTSRTTRRTLLLLATMGVAALVLPTMKWVTHGPLAGPAALVADDTKADARNVGGGADRREKPGAESKGRDAAVDVEYLPRPSKFEERVLAALEKPIDIAFLDRGLEDCFAYLQEESKIPMWLDRQTLTDEGVALDQKITLKLKGGRLESVLNLILNPVQLTYFPENDVLMITSHSKAGENLITRTYPVRDLCQGRVDAHGEPPQKDDKAAVGDALGRGIASVESHQMHERHQVIGVIHQLGATRFGGEIDIQIAQGFGGGGQPGGGNGGAAATSKPAPPNNYGNLMNAITSTIQPDSWEDLSGPGSMMPVREAGCLVIRQTWAVHRQILQLLRDLREAKHLAPGGKALTPAGDRKK